VIDRKTEPYPQFLWNRKDAILKDKHAVQPLQNLRSKEIQNYNNILQDTPKRDKVAAK
jgi:hypothetical protein